jgi:hypothetical protein
MKIGHDCPNKQSIPEESSSLRRSSVVRDSIRVVGAGVGRPAARVGVSLDLKVATCNFLLHSSN